VRISAGVLKGKKIGDRQTFSTTGPAGILRPTSAKVREALFDILRDEVTDSSFLDLYAGSGTVGFEALSRGAGKVCFVESDPDRSKGIAATIAKAGLGGRAALYVLPAAVFLQKADRSGTHFDIIFADPPYASEEVPDLIAAIDKGGCLEKGGTFIIEHASKRPLEDTGTLRVRKKYRYGDTMLTRYRRVP